MHLKTAIFAAAFGAILLGWFQLARFSSTPGEQAAAPALLPADFPLPAPGPLLLVFIHPQCNCTPATLRQLDRLLAARHRAVQVVLAVYDSAPLRSHPAIQPAAWLHQPYRLLQDVDGRLAHRLGAATSGEVLLYSPTRQLLFQGGITPERAQTGDSPGLASLRQALDSESPLTPPSRLSSVFGCPIFSLENPG